MTARRRYENAVDVPVEGSTLLLAVYRGEMSEVKYRHSFTQS